MPAFSDGFLGVPARPGKPRQVGPHARHRQGPQPPRHRGSLRHRRRVRRHRQVRLGNELRHEQPREEDLALPVARDARGLRRHALRGGLRPRPARRVQELARREPLLARRDLRRDARHPARPEARADRRVRPRLHGPLRGRVEGLRRRLRAVPVGAVDQGGARRRRLEGDHGGPRGRHLGDLPLRRRHANGADRRDRPRDLGRRGALRGADEVVAGVVREALRAERQPRQHPAGRGDRRRDAAPRPARRHPEGDPARRPSPRARAEPEPAGRSSWTGSCPSRAC